MKRLLAALGVAFVLAIPATASAHDECVEVSDVVGERKCGRYGSGWSAERGFRFVLGGGLWTSSVSPIGRDFSGKTTEKGPSEYTYAGSQLGLDRVQSFGFDMRMHGFVTPALYLGLDWSMGLGVAKPNEVKTSEGWTLTQRTGLRWMHVKVAPVIGVRIPLGRISLRLETLVGLEIIGLSQYAVDPSGSMKHGNASHVSFLLEPRAAVDLWTGPWSTITVWGSTNALRTSDGSVGLLFSFHATPYDGKFSL